MIPQEMTHNQKSSILSLLLFVFVAAREIEDLVLLDWSESMIGDLFFQHVWVTVVPKNCFRGPANQPTSHTRPAGFHYRKKCKMSPNKAPSIRSSGMWHSEQTRLSDWLNVCVGHGGAKCRSNILGRKVLVTSTFQSSFKGIRNFISTPPNWRVLYCRSDFFYGRCNLSSQFRRSYLPISSLVYHVPRESIRFVHTNIYLSSSSSIFHQTNKKNFFGIYYSLLYCYYIIFLW